MHVIPNVTSGLFFYCAPAIVATLYLFPPPEDCQESISHLQTLLTEYRIFTSAQCNCLQDN